jgi:hypothetical protein
VRSDSCGAPGFRCRAYHSWRPADTRSYFEGGIVALRRALHRENLWAVIATDDRLDGCRDRARFDALAAEMIDGIDSGCTFLALDHRLTENDSAGHYLIWSSVDGSPYYFELGEVTDSSVAYSLAKALENDEPAGGAFSQTEPFRDILTSKAGKTYVSNGSPIDLLLHYQKQSPPWQQYFAEMVERHAREINAVLSVNGGPYQRLWIFDGWKRDILLKAG